MDAVGESVTNALNLGCDLDAFALLHRYSQPLFKQPLREEFIYEPSAFLR